MVRRYAQTSADHQQIYAGKGGSISQNNVAGKKLVSRLGFDPSTLALKGHNPHNKPIPIFRDFFILSHFPILHYTDTFHMDPGSCRQTVDCNYF